MKIILEEYEDKYITLDIDSDCEQYHLKIKQFSAEDDVIKSIKNFKRIEKYLNEIED